MPSYLIGAKHDWFSRLATPRDLQTIITFHSAIIEFEEFSVSSKNREISLNTANTDEQFVYLRLTSRTVLYAKRKGTREPAYTHTPICCSSFYGRCGPLDLLIHVNDVMLEQKT